MSLFKLFFTTEEYAWNNPGQPGVGCLPPTSTQCGGALLLMAGFSFHLLHSRQKNLRNASDIGSPRFARREPGEQKSLDKAGELDLFQLQLEMDLMRSARSLSLEARHDQLFKLSPPKTHQQYLFLIEPITGMFLLVS